MFKRSFRFFVLVLDNRAACDDLSRLDSSALRFQVQPTDSYNRFYRPFFNFAARFPPRLRKTHVFAKSYQVARAMRPSLLAAAISLTCPIFDISQRPPSSILRKSCSPVCTEYTPWMNGVPPRSSRCAKHRVRNTWPRCLRRTWYLVTSTGRCGPLAQAKLPVAQGKGMIFITVLVPSGPHRSS